MKRLILLSSILLLGVFVVVSHQELKQRLISQKKTTNEVLTDKSIASLLSRQYVLQGEYEYFVTEKHLHDDLELYGVKVVQNYDKQEKAEVGQGIIAVNKPSGSHIRLIDASGLVKYDFGRIQPGGHTYKDMNADGKREFIITEIGFLSSVRAAYEVIFQLTEKGFKRIAEDTYSGIQGFENQNSKLFTYDVVDLDNDGLYELKVIDVTWESNICMDHGSSPIIERILVWENGKYIGATERFQDRYKKLRSEKTSRVNVACTEKKDFCLGPALSEYLFMTAYGHEKEGWEKFLRVTEGVPDTSWPSNKCRNYIVRAHKEGREIIPPKDRDL